MRIPLGIYFLSKVTCCWQEVPHRQSLYRFLIVLLTFLSYTGYHMCKKPISVVKSVLYRNCSRLVPPPDTDIEKNPEWCCWAPFDREEVEASELLGQLDTTFLFTYAAFMFISGYVAERVNLRYFLCLGMALTGVACYLQGFAKLHDVHYMWYFLLTQFLLGIFQSTGWPCVVTLMGKWFGHSKRGLLFGVWNSHTSIGNILGTLIAAEFVETNWGFSFIVPGAIIGGLALLNFLFLVNDPEDVNCEVEVESETQPVYRRLTNQVANTSDGSDGEDVNDTEILIGEQEVIMRRHSSLSDRSKNMIPSKEEQTAIGFFAALKLPGVLEYSFALFFAKLVSYTFLFWLPFYINASTDLNPRKSADLSTLFDIGGIVGAIVAGGISDHTGMSATTCVGMLTLAIPMLLVYQQFSYISLTMNMSLLIALGLLINGPYALITTAVSAELGTHASAGGSEGALATVTAIIDGTGSIGAAVGPLLASYVQGFGWEYVFIMLMVSNALALVLLFRLFREELRTFVERRRYHRID